MYRKKRGWNVSPPGPIRILACRWFSRKKRESIRLNCRMRLCILCALDHPRLPTITRKSNVQGWILNSMCLLILKLRRIFFCLLWKLLASNCIYPGAVGWNVYFRLKFCLKVIIIPRRTFLPLLEIHGQVGMIFGGNVFDFLFSRFRIIRRNRRQSTPFYLFALCVGRCGG